MADRFANEKDTGVVQARQEALSTEPYAPRTRGRSRAPAGKTAEIFDAPPTDALKDWGLIMGSRLRSKPAKYAPLAERVERRLLRTSAGVKLVADLQGQLGRRRPPAMVNVTFTFPARFPASDFTEGVSGYFEPREPDQDEYDVYVGWERDELDAYAKVISGVRTELKRGVSFMAQTLFHELLHVWFIHAHRGLGTGHGAFDGKRGQYDSIDPEFQKCLVAMLRQLELIEAREQHRRAR